MSRVRMKRYFLLFSATVLASVNASAQSPSLSGVVSAASYAPVGLPNNGLAPGSFFYLGGSNIGPASIVVNSEAIFPTTLSDTSVTFSVGGTTTKALMYYTSAGAVAGIVPSNTPVGTGTVTLAYKGATASSPVTIVAANFAAFTQNAGGSGPASAQDYTVGYQLNTLRASSKPGAGIILYGTGMGACPSGDQGATGGSGCTGTDLRGSLDFHVYVGRQEAAVSYAGRTGYAGLDQVNFTIPASATPGCYVPVIVRIGNLVSNVSSIAVESSGTTCSDPYGLTASQIEKASTGKLNVASILLTRLGVQITGLGAVVTEDDAVGRFYQFDGGTYGFSPEHLGDFIGLSSFGSCAVTVCTGTSTCVPSAQTLALPHLDAGAQLTVKKSDGSGAVAIPRQTNGFYSAHVATNPVVLPGYPSPASNYFQPGTFNVSGAGGPDIGSFSADIAVGSTLTWDSPQVAASGANVARTQDLTVNWTGGGASDYVLISATSATNVAAAPATANYNGATITCLEKASAGTFTVPSWLLQSLPVSSDVNLGPITQHGGAILVGIFNASNTFTSSADVSLANSIVLSGKTVQVQ